MSGYIDDFVEKCGAFVEVGSAVVQVHEDAYHVGLVPVINSLLLAPDFPHVENLIRNFNISQL